MTDERGAGRVNATPPGGPPAGEHDGTAGAGSATAPAAGKDAVVLTRSEEQMRVGTETVPVARVRVRKVIVTEERTITVVLRHEEFLVETEPISGDSPVPTQPDGSPTRTPPGGPNTVELVLHAERPVLTTEVVPVERIRVSTHLVTSQESITAPVQREVVELDPPR